MSQSWPRPGVNHVGEYQVSGHILPITSTATHNLKYVASSITAVAAGDITFFDGGGASRTVAVTAGTRIVGKFIKFTNTANVVVELTNVPAGDYLAPNFSDLEL
jgi:hypothetical protein